MADLSVLERAVEEGYSPWLIHDDDGHWAVCDTGMSSVPPTNNEPFYFSGEIDPDQWFDSISEALEAYAKTIDL